MILSHSKHAPSSSYLKIIWIAFHADGGYYVSESTRKLGLRIQFHLSDSSYIALNLLDIYLLSSSPKAHDLNLEHR